MLLQNKNYNILRYFFLKQYFKLQFTFYIILYWFKVYNIVATQSYQGEIFFNIRFLPCQRKYFHYRNYTQYCSQLLYPQGRNRTKRVVPVLCSMTAQRQEGKMWVGWCLGKRGAVEGWADPQWKYYQRYLSWVSVLLVSVVLILTSIPPKYSLSKRSRANKAVF